MTNNNLPVNSKSEISKIERQMEIVSKLLPNPINQRFVDYFLRHPEFFINMISHYFPLDQNTVSTYKAKLDWGWLHLNRSFSWTESFISENESYFKFSSPPAMSEEIWTPEFIKKYESKWNWSSLSLSRTIPFSIKLIDQFKNKW